MKSTYSKRQMAKNLALAIHIVVFLITSFFAIVNYNLALYYSAICCAFLALNSLLASYLHILKNKFQLSNLMTFLSLNLGLTVLGYLEGVMSGYHLYFFTIIYAIPFFLRVRKNGINRLKSLSWYAASIAFIVLTLKITPLYSDVYDIDKATTHNKLIINFAGSFITIILFSLLSMESANKYAKALEEGKQKAEDEKEARTRVLSNLGHELRTQITSINGVVQLILEKSKNTVSRINDEENYYSILEYCNKQMLFLVNDVLDMHKIEVGKFDLFLESKQLGNVLSEITLPFLNRAKNKNIELKSSVDKALFDVSVRIDDQRLTQVLHNLISNAIKFTSKGSVSFKAQLQHQTENEITVLFSVVDTGIGISKSNHHKIFDSFQQIKEEDKPIYGGTGLGLAISKTIIEKMNSKIEVDSVVDLGTSFFFEIVFSKTSKEGCLEVKDAVSYDGFLENTTVLVVEDNKVNMLYTSKLVKKYGASVYQAENGEEAVNMVKNHVNIDVVLLDLEMPKMNGFTAIKHIKKMRPDLMVIAFTANIPDTSMLKKLDNLGFNDIVSKPFKNEDLFSILNKYTKTSLPSNRTAS